MPEYLSPGVYVEESSNRHESIEGVDIRVAAIVGPTTTGPVNSTPEVLTTFDDFVGRYGGLDDIEFADGTVPNYTAISARAFFANGGKRLFIVRVTGTAGAAPNEAAYAGKLDEGNGSTGFAALEGVEEVAIVLAPAATAAGPRTHEAVIAAMDDHCTKSRYGIGLVDARAGMTPAEVRSLASRFASSRLALYYPWVVIDAPSETGKTLVVPPSGFVAGIYSRTVTERGAHKAPANAVVRGALRFERNIDDAEQEALNPAGVNCLRSFTGRGNLVWGARTLSAAPEWKYVNVRRYLDYLQRSIEKSTHWVVFEPNAEPLWARMRAVVSDFLSEQWRAGHLAGARQEEGFFVRCDRSTMTQNDLDNGRLISLIGVAPVKPAEFIVFRIGLKTADSTS